MADSMMRPPVGSSLKVSGIRIAVPAAGPSPGRTPISVPRMQPTMAKARFCQLMAAARPVIRCCRVSTVASLYSEHADGQRHLEPIVENVKHAEAARDCCERDGEQGARAECQQQAGDEGQHGEAEAEGLQES